MKSIFSVFLMFTFSLALAQKNPGNFTVMFYNVENLFDTIDDPHHNDNEFLPSAEKNWNTGKYQIKLRNLAKVISAVVQPDFPDVVGVCEIENKQVLQDLVNTPALRNAGYEIIHQESRDQRGIDVAILFRKERFKVLTKEFIPVHFPEHPDSKTRDILLVSGIAFKDTLHFFVNHWPSRLGGEAKSANKRYTAAKLLRHKSDSLLKINMNRKIIIMGDFNDHPNDSSIFSFLNARPLNSVSGDTLRNMMFEKMEKQGSYHYKGKWEILDQFIVSSSVLLSKTGLRLMQDGASIFKADWLIYIGKKGPEGPSRSFSGPKFNENGYSDHLPIVLKLGAK